MDASVEEAGFWHGRDFVEAVNRSLVLHGEWVTAPATPEQFESHLKKYSSDRDKSFVVCTESGDLAGCINLNEIVRGCFQSAYLGYYSFEPFQAKGYMKQGLSLVITRAFGEFKLHRLEANIQPENTSSIALVESLGFRLEGFSPCYLKFGELWKDHQRYAITVEDWY